MKTLRDYLVEYHGRQIIEHALRVNVDEYGIVTFYIHPHGHSGDTLDFRVGEDGNSLVPVDPVILPNVADNAQRMLDARNVTGEASLPAEENA